MKDFNHYLSVCSKFSTVSLCYSCDQGSGERWGAGEALQKKAKTPALRITDSGTCLLTRKVQMTWELGTAQARICNQAWGVGSSFKSKVVDLEFWNFGLGTSGFVLFLESHSPGLGYSHFFFPNIDHLVWWFKHIPKGATGLYKQQATKSRWEGHTPISGL